MYEETEELRHDLTKLSEKFDEWSGREMTYTQLENKKSDIEKELKNNIENMGNKEERKGISSKEDLKGMASKEDLKVIASKGDVVKMAKEMDSKEYIQELMELITDIKHRSIPYFSTQE